MLPKRAFVISSKIPCITAVECVFNLHNFSWHVSCRILGESVKPNSLRASCFFLTVLFIWFFFCFSALESYEGSRIHFQCRDKHLNLILNPIFWHKHLNTHLCEPLRKKKKRTKYKSLIPSGCAFGWKYLLIKPLSETNTFSN